MLDVSKTIFDGKLLKFLIVGSWLWEQYEDAFAKSLSLNKIKIEKFETSVFFSGFLGKYAEAIPFPSLKLFSLNRSLIKFVEENNYDAVIFWRPTHFLPSTINYINQKGIKTISYNNDDPFGPYTHKLAPWHHRFLWYWYFKSLPLFNKNFFYREINCKEAKSIGIKHAELLMPYFLPWRDRPLELNQEDQKKFLCDVTFIGHYENDGREKYIQALASSSIDFKLWGGEYWTEEVLGDAYDLLTPINSVYGEEYVKAINGSKICLCFLSKINRDKYTRRCFEIPAMGKVLLSERTDELSSIFIENKEAVFFSSVEEMMEKIEWLLKNPDICHNIGKAGMKKSWDAGLDIHSRTKVFLGQIH